MTKTKRPWQGTVLGIIFSLLLMALITGVILSIYTMGMSFIISQSPKVGANFLGMIPTTLTTAFILTIILTLTIKGIFSGSKLAMIVAFLGIAFNIIFNLITLLRSLFSGDFTVALFNLAGMVFMAGICWLTIISLKTPFYGGNGKISWQTFKFWQKNREMADF